MQDTSYDSIGDVCAVAEIDAVQQRTVAPDQLEGRVADVCDVAQLDVSPRGHKEGVQDGLSDVAALAVADEVLQYWLQQVRKVPQMFAQIVDQTRRIVALMQVAQQALKTITHNQA